MWGIVSSAVPGAVIQAELVGDPNSLENLSPANPNGWGIGYYPGSSTAPVVSRGQPEADLDPLYDQAVTASAGSNPPVAVAHNCASTRRWYRWS